MGFSFLEEMAGFCPGIKVSVFWYYRGIKGQDTRPCTCWLLLVYRDCNSFRFHLVNVRFYPSSLQPNSILLRSVKRQVFPDADFEVGNFMSLNGKAGFPGAKCTGKDIESVGTHFLPFCMASQFSRRSFLRWYIMRKLSD